MMFKVKLAQISWVVVWVLLIQNYAAPSYSQSEPSYRYALLDYAQSVPLLTMLSIRNEVLDVQTQSLTFATDQHTLIYGNTSPDGLWIALITQDSENSEGISHVGNTALIQVATGDTFTLEHPPITSGTDNVNLPIEETVVWSPNSEYLAINVWEGDQSDIYVYSTVERSFFNLTSDSAEQYRIAWSLDSSAIATLSADCSLAPCQSRISILEIQNRRERIANPLPTDQTRQVAASSGGCELTWSPNGQLLAYQSVCSGTESPKEIYLWDIIVDQTQQITDFTSTIPSGAIVYRMANYFPFWYTENTLAIGAEYARSTEMGINQSHATILYDYLSSTRRTIADYAVEAWSVNPRMPIVAVRLEEESDTFSSQASGLIDIFLLDDLQNHLQTSSAESTHIRMNEIGQACGLSWSPDGINLATWASDSNQCSTSGRNWTFLDSTGAVLATYSVNGFGLSLGWVVE